MRGQFDFSHQGQDNVSNRRRPAARILGANQGRLEAPEDMLIERHSRDVLLSWRSPEFIQLERDRKWYLVVTIILLAIIAYAVFVNGLVMAITFILIGVVGYLYINNSPKILDFAVTKKGIIAGNVIYEFKNLESFWIFYEPERHETEVVSLKTKSYLSPYVHIPIKNHSAEEVRQVLSQYIEEDEHEPGFVESLERLLRL